MVRYSLFFAGAVCIGTLGCSGQPGAVEKAASSKKVVSEDIGEPPPQEEPPLDEIQADLKTPGASKLHSEPIEQSDEPQQLELKDSGLTFQIPGQWKRVKPDNRIVEAEFELTNAQGDEYPGRLTLMSSGGSAEDALSRRTGEFKFEPGEGPSKETFGVGGIESTLVDFRGVWKDSSRPSESRSGYRMLLVIVPFTERSAFYAKLTGPRATIAAHENDFREFLKSAKITR